MGKYYFIPKKLIFGTSNASKGKAWENLMKKISENPEKYFTVSEGTDELVSLVERYPDVSSNIHDRFVTSFMESELRSQFGLSKKAAKEVACRAYDIYAEGDGLTEYESIEKAYEEFESGE